jgi:hypothetical protein
MGWRFRKIFQTGPLRWSITKKGVGWSWGIPGIRYGVSPTGQHYVSFGIPGTGLYFIKYFNEKKPNISTADSEVLPKATSQTGITSKKAVEPWWKQQNLDK